MSIIDAGRLQRQLDGWAKRTNNLMMEGVVFAVAVIINAPGPKTVKLARERTIDRGASKGLVDRCFAMASKIAPRVEDAVKAAANHDAALAQITVQVAALKGALAWKAFEDSLKPEVAKAAPLPVAPVVDVTTVEEAAEDAAEVANAAPAATPMERFVSFVDSFDWSADDLASMVAVLNERWHAKAGTSEQRKAA